MILPQCAGAQNNSSVVVTDMTKLLDANTVIRYLVADDPKKSTRIERILTKSFEKLILTDVSLVEIVWVLDSHYQIAKREIVGKLQTLLLLDVIEANKSLLSDALDIYWSHNIDFIDAYIAAYAKGKGIDVIVSYDRDLDKVTDVTREEP